jgi:hypothetical protein
MRAAFAARIFFCGDLQSFVMRSHRSDAIEKVDTAIDRIADARCDGRAPDYNKAILHPLRRRPMLMRYCD